MCGKQGDASAIRLCSPCKTIRYCSRDCQSRDWPRHKAACKAADAAGDAFGSSGELTPFSCCGARFFLVPVTNKVLLGGKLKITLIYVHDERHTHTHTHTHTNVYALNNDDDDIDDVKVEADNSDAAADEDGDDDDDNNDNAWSKKTDYD